jgi:hypothetical protein
MLYIAKLLFHQQLEQLYIPNRKINKNLFISYSLTFSDRNVLITDDLPTFGYLKYLINIKEKLDIDYYPIKPIEICFLS